MKIALVEPKTPDYNVYTRWMKDLPLLGLPYLGTILKERGHDVTIYNENITGISVKDLEPYDVVGFSLMTGTATRGYTLAERVRRLNPDKKIIIGGSHATFMPDEAANFADHVIKGEAETVIADVVENGGEKIIQGKPVEDLDDLPFPDLSLIKGYKLPARLLPISTSRGCPYECDFCSVSPMFGTKYRFRSTDDVIEELSQYDKLKLAFFYDDNFTAHKGRTRELLEKMLEKDIKVKWIAQARADVYKNEELVKLMADANCYALCIGFESVNEETLLAYNKKQSVKDMEKCIKMLHKYGIKVHGMFLSEGFYDYNKLGIDTLQLMVPIPLPGSQLFEKVKAAKQFFKERNPLKDTKWWKYFDGAHVVHIPERFHPKELQEQTIRSWKKFYSKWNCFKQLIKMNFGNLGFRRMGKNIVAKWEKSNKEFMENLEARAMQ
ncbi:B12-binding domain-containing radical SAM protein [Candidatus Woesearchaeota archaeon]|nr:B12-binding domain-containing radical SAM protein [Candidatus Woesearchaeota archaeon]